MKALLRDPLLAAELDGQGACQVPFLLESERAEALRLFERLHPAGHLPVVVRGIHMTIHSDDRAYKRDVRDGLLKILAPACDRLLRGYRLVAPFFIVKPMGQDSSVQLHQDICAVDERLHWAVKLWIPLEDASLEHGALWYLPGSHRLDNHVRGLGALWPRLVGVEESARPRLRVCNAASGSAVVFYHRLVHGSPPNVSGGPRVAISVGVVPEAVPLRIYVQESPQHPLEVYEAPDDFPYEQEAALTANAGLAPPGGRRVEVLPSHERPVVRWGDLEPLLVA